MADDDDDCWDAFGSDSDDSDDGGGNDDDSNSDQLGTNGTSQQLQQPSAEETKAAPSIAMHLSQSFAKHNPQVRLSDRTVLVVRARARAATTSDHTERKSCPISEHLAQRGMRVLRTVQEEDEEGIGIGIVTGLPLADAIVVLPADDGDDESANHELVRSRLCPGGVLIIARTRTSTGGNGNGNNDDEDCVFAPNGPGARLLAPGAATTVHATASTRWIARRKRTILAHSLTCPWLSAPHSVAAEEERLGLATVALASHEMAAPSKSNGAFGARARVRSSGKLTEHSLQKAVRSMTEHGYCILPGLLDADECSEWGSAVLDSFHAAATILKNRDGVDIYHPQSSEREPQAYRELSMREDLRLDLRQGPALSKLRAQKEGSAVRGGRSVVVTAAEDHIGDGLFLRGHPSLLEIVRRTMNPKEQQGSSGSNGSGNKPLHLGNLGRWNFGGSGNDGSYQNLRVSPVGGIVSLPGSAEQALHADTPHLFEHLPDLPAHYINLFAPCTAFDEAVGGTAFVHGSHDLRFVAERYDASHNSGFYPWLVRPQLTVGDVVLFDCRILHFGLANRSETVERCICYVNTWQDWFHDAKNWDQNRAIFEADGGEYDGAAADDDDTDARP